MKRKRISKQLYYKATSTKEGTAILFPSMDARDAASEQLTAMGVRHSCRINTHTVDVPTSEYRKHDLQVFPGYILAWSYVVYMKVNYPPSFNFRNQPTGDIAEIIEACKVR